MKLVDQGKYRPIERARAGVIHGTALWALGRKEKALESLKLASSVKVRGQLSRWSVWALIRSAQLEDQLGMREAALTGQGRNLEALQGRREARTDPDPGLSRTLQ